MEDELLQRINLQGGLEESAFSRFPHTAQFWKTYGKPPQTLEYVHSGEPVKIPAFYYLDLEQNRQLEIARALAQATTSDSRELVYEIGYGHSLSPLDTAFAGKDRTVIGVDPKGQFYGRLRAGVENLKLPSLDSTSFAAFFKVDAKELAKEVQFPKARWVQSFSPFENMIGEILNVGTRLSDQVYIVPNPMGLDRRILEEALTTLPVNYSGTITNPSRAQLEERLGTSMSAFMAGIGPDDTVALLEAHSRNSP